VILAKHFNLYGWIHGNAFRTSHYPYADELYQMADRFGIAIIGETPGVGLRKPQYFSQITLEHHKVMTAKMIRRDRNHPSVLMLSLANEPLSEAPEAKPYFSVLANFTRPIAAGRPITFVISAEYSKDQCAQFFDMICVNRYFGWYSQSGRLDQISSLVSEELANWRQMFPNKPILVSEYDADTIPGLHNDPPFMFTEEYQKEFLSAYHGSFDNVSSMIDPDTSYFVGELVWNVFDFATDQSIKRVGVFNYKDLFTRQSQPKAAAFIMKNRYEQLELAQTLNHKII
jgi:beta-glucuronidase